MEFGAYMLKVYGGSDMGYYVLLSTTITLVWEFFSDDRAREVRRIKLIIPSMVHGL